MAPDVKYSDQRRPMRAEVAPELPQSGQEQRANNPSATLGLGDFRNGKIRGRMETHAAFEHCSADLVVFAIFGSPRSDMSSTIGIAAQRGRSAKAGGKQGGKRKKADGQVETTNLGGPRRRSKPSNTMTRCCTGQEWTTIGRPLGAPRSTRIENLYIRKTMQHFASS